MTAVEHQSLLGFDNTSASANPPRADLVDPDRSEDGEQPPIEPGSRRELLGALDRAHAGRSNEVIRSVVRGRKNDGVAPEASQTRLEPQAHFASARFAHVQLDTMPGVKRRRTLFPPPSHEHRGDQIAQFERPQKSHPRQRNTPGGELFGRLRLRFRPGLGLSRRRRPAFAVVRRSKRAAATGSRAARQAGAEPVRQGKTPVRVCESAERQASRDP